jgi:hypothetical protein
MMNPNGENDFIHTHSLELAIERSGWRPHERKFDPMSTSALALREELAAIVESSQHVRRDVQLLIADQLRFRAPELLGAVATGDPAAVRAAAAELRGRIDTLLSFA